MRYTRLQSVVLQAALLYALHLILTHEIYQHWDTSFLDDPVLKNYTTALESHSKFPTGLAHLNNDPDAQRTLPSPPLVNDTLIDNDNNNNGTSGCLGDGKKQKSFYANTLPKKMILNAVFTILLYYWHLLLEYLLPARPSTAVKLTEKSAADALEPREEELMKSLIERGKIQRPSISWGNTLVKWFLEMSVGTLWQEIFRLFIFNYFLLENNPFAHSFSQVAISLFFSFVGAIFSHQNVASFFAFIVVPAAQRPVFREGTDALVEVFFAAAIQIILKGAVKTKFAQDFMIKATAEILEGAQGGTQQGHMVDEL